MAIGFAPIAVPGWGGARRVVSLPRRATGSARHAGMRLLEQGKRNR
jgi:hypothetical protein